MLSVVLIFIDHKLDGFKSTRVYLNSLMTHFSIANLRLMLNESAQRLTSQEQLLSENQKLNNQLLLMSEKLQRFDVIAKENAQLRVTAGTYSGFFRRMVAELIAVDKNPYAAGGYQQGAIDGVYLSQLLLMIRA